MTAPQTRKNHHRRVLGVMLLAVSMSLVLAPAVLAHPMDGYGTVATDDWSWDEHLLCRPQDCSGEISSGNVVGVWQAILWSEGYLAQCGSAGVDGVFGTTTRNATKSLQSAWGLTSDGKVGNQSWGRADNNLRFESFPGDKSLYYDATFSSTVLWFYKPSSTYQIAWFGAWHNTDHYNRSIDQC